MAIFIGHKTALAYWRTHDRNWSQPISQAMPRKNSSPFYSQIDTGILWKLGIDEKPVSLLVSHETNRRRSQNLCPHIWSEKHPSRSFYKIAESLYMSTPEATFLQLGNELGLIQLITIGYELCGSYGLSAQSDNGFLQKEPRSNPQLIKRYLAKCSGFHGIKTTKRAANYIVKGSASPMESLLSMLLCLPPLLGGFGLPRPELNHPIETNDGRFSVRRCDLCWPNQQFALEYDSDAFHSERSRLHLDSSRRSTLEKEGIHVVSVTKNQVFDRSQLLDLATIASKRLGKRLSPTPFDFPRRQDEIYRVAFGSAEGKPKSAGC